MHLIDGKSLARQHHAELREKLSRQSRTPGLAILLVGQDPSSHLYVRLKEKACAEVGIHFEKLLFPADEKMSTILETIERLNQDPKIHGIVVQLPLPAHLDENRVIEAIDPNKDVDGFHPANLKKLRDGKAQIVPALTQSIVDLIESTGRPLAGRNAVIIANSQIFAEPIIYQLRQRGAQAEYIGSDPADPRSALADIVVIAIGRPHSLTRDMVTNDAILIDVGITETSAGVQGDVDLQSFAETDCWVTPVPGGVGPMTVAHLLLNTYQASTA